jgi:hypothetical protein
MSHAGVNECIQRLKQLPPEDAYLNHILKGIDKLSTAVNEHDNVLMGCTKELVIGFRHAVVDVRRFPFWERLREALAGLRDACNTAKSPYAPSRLDQLETFAKVGLTHVAAMRSKLNNLTGGELDPFANGLHHLGELHTPAQTQAAYDRIRTMPDALYEWTKTPYEKNGFAMSPAQARALVQELPHHAPFAVHDLMLSLSEALPRLAARLRDAHYKDYANDEALGAIGPMLADIRHYLNERGRVVGEAMHPRLGDQSLWATLPPDLVASNIAPLLYRDVRYA